MSDDVVVQRLAEVDLFENLPPRVLNHIASEGSVQSFPAGAVVVEEGASVQGWASMSREGVRFYVILEGSAEIEVHGDRRSTLEAGSHFGETSLIDGKPRSATVIAGPEGMKAFTITAWAFQPILEQNPTVAISMLKALAGRLRAVESIR